MKKFNISIIIVMVFFLFACVPSAPVKKAENTGGTDSVPSWVTTPPDVPGYIYGVGMASLYGTEAEAIMRAKENARVELIKQLKVKVIGETTASVRREISGGKSKITRSVFNYANSRIEETELPGIKVIKNAVSKKDRQAFALAELSISSAEMSLEDSLESIDKRISMAMKDRAETSRIKEIKRLIPVIKLIEKRKKIVSDIKLISSMSDAQYETEEHRRIIKKVANLLDSLVIVIKKDSSLDPSLASGIRKSLSDQGVKIRSGGSGDLYMKFSASLNSVLRNGVFFTFATGNASVMDANNNVISEFKTKVKAGSGDEKLSSKRAVEKLADKLGNSIAKSLFDSI